MSRRTTKQRRAARRRRCGLISDAWFRQWGEAAWKSIHVPVIIGGLEPARDVVVQVQPAAPGTTTWLNAWTGEWGIS